MSNTSFKVKNGLTLVPTDLTSLLNPQAGDLACDINDSNKIKRYDDVAFSWVEVGSGGGTTDPDVLYIQTFDTSTTANFVNDGLQLATTTAIHGDKSAFFTHGASLPKYVAMNMDVDPKFRGTNMTAALLIKSTASEGNVTFVVQDTGNGAILTTQSIQTDSQAIASLTTTISSTTVSGFSNVAINDLSIGMSVTGTGIQIGTTISAINTTALTVTLSQTASASGTVTLRFSALPKTVQLGFSIPTSTTNIDVYVNCLAESGSPETYIDDVKISNYFLGMSNQGQTDVSIETPIVTEWQDYTPTGAWVSNITYSGKYRRVGSDMEISIYGLMSGAGTLAPLTVNLPVGFTIDTTKFAGAGVFLSSLYGGGGDAFDTSAAAHYAISASLNGTSAVILTVESTALGQVTALNQTVPFTWATGDTFSASAKVPIQGWAATETQSFTTTDLVPAKAVLGNTTLDIPAISSWTSYTPVLTHTTGGITNATPTAKWRQVGEDIEVQGSIAFSAASAAFSGLFVSLPNGYSLDSNKIANMTGNAVFGTTNWLDIAINNGGIGSVVYSGSTSTVYLTAPGVTTHTGTAPVVGANIGNAFPITFNTGDAISFEFRFPAVGLSATEEVVVSGTQAALVQQPDSMIRLSGANGFGSTATTTRRFSGIVSSIGSDILYVDSATLGAQFTAQRAGIYNISYSENSTANNLFMDVRILLNGALIAFDCQSLNTATVNAKFASTSIQVYMNVGDIITPSVSTAVNNNGANAEFTMSRAGSLQVATVNADQKIKIPTSELRFEGASARGAVATGIVKFDTLAKIRGDAFTVTNTANDGTYVTMTKAGILNISASLALTSINTQIYISKNQAILTAAPLASETLASSQAYAATVVVTAAAPVYANIGDVFRICATGAVTSDTENSLNLVFQEQSIQVSVSNTLPQFSESDSMIRVSGANGFGSTATTTRRYASVVQNLGTDIEYTDSATLGGQFKALTSGVYHISYSELSISSSQYSTIYIVLNGGPNLAYNGSTYNTANTDGKYNNASWSGYLTAGDTISAGVGSAAQNNGQDVKFTMSKVGKPNVTGVNVTPFVNLAFDKGSIGEVKAFAGNVDGDSYLACDGTAVSRGTYSALFAAIGTSHGQGDGSTTFNLPDYRGRFLRGVTGASANDPDAASRTAMNTGGNTGNNVGSVQADQNLAHTHVQSYWNTVGGGTLANERTGQAAFGNTASSLSTQSSGGTEARPKNAYVNYGIRFKAANEAILTPTETFSSDTAGLVYAGSGTYTLATLANAPVGTFITYTYAINTNTRTQTTTAPTQTTSDMNANGILLYTRAYNAASTAAQPACIAIQIGKGLKGLNLGLYKSSGKTTSGNLDNLIQGTTNQSGATYKDYNEVTGILLVDVGIAELGTNTSRTLLFSDVTSQTSGYLVINASKNPALTGMNVNRVAARAVQTSGQSIANATNVTLTWDAAKTFDTHGALNAATGIFTAPESGYYQVDARVLYNTASYPSGTSLEIDLYKNGVIYSVLSRWSWVNTAFVEYPNANGSDVVFLTKGDTISITTSQSSGSAKTIIASATQNYFSIAKIGN